jgi:predicted histidine transporter YuiF (NhaC family)
MIQTNNKSYKIVENIKQVSGLTTNIKVTTNITEVNNGIKRETIISESIEILGDVKNVQRTTNINETPIINEQVSEVKQEPEQLKQEQVKQEQVKQEQVKQVKQEQVKQEQVKQESESLLKIITCHCAVHYYQNNKSFIVCKLEGMLPSITFSTSVKTEDLITSLRNAINELTILDSNTYIIIYTSYKKFIDIEEHNVPKNMKFIYVDLAKNDEDSAIIRKL